MTKCLHISGGSTATTANTTQYFSPAGGTIAYTTTEANTQVKYYNAGTITRLQVRVSANSVASNSTVRIRKGGANGNNTVTLTASTTGLYEDTSSSDTISANDLIDLQSVPGAATGTYTITVAAYLFDATSDTVSKFVANTQLTLADTFLPMTGVLLGNATEANYRTRQRKTGDFKNFAILISSNGKSSNGSCFFRKNGVDSATVTVTASTTGLFEQTGTTVSVAAGDDVNWRYDLPGGGGSTIAQLIHCEYIDTNGFGQLIGSNNALNTRAGTIVYFVLSGFQISNTAAASSAKAQEAFTFSELTSHVTTNSLTADITITLYNGADTSLQNTITTGTTNSYISDSSDTAVVAATDLVAIKYGGAGTGTIVLPQISVYTSIVSAGNNVVRALPTETVSISDGIARLTSKIRTRSETVTIGETPTRQAAKNRPLAIQTVTLSESIIRVKGKVKAPPAETVTIGGGTVSRLAAKTRARSETVVIGENATRLAAKNRIVPAETVIVGAGIAARIKGKVKTISETVIVGGGTVARLAAKTRAISQTITVSDSATRLAAKIRAISQTVVVADNVARSTTKLIIKTLSDTVVIGDALVRLANKNRPISQTVAISDNAARLAAKSRIVPTQTVTVGGGTVIKLKGAVRTISQTVAISESLNRIAAKIRAIPTQTVIVSDSLNRLSAKMRALATQTITITDNVARQITGGQQDIIKSITETVTIGESLARRANKTRVISQTVTIGETLNKTKAAIRTLAVQTVIVTDSVTASKIRSVIRSLSDTVALSESLARLKSSRRPTLETVTIGELVARRKSANRSLLESTPTGEILTRVKGTLRSILQTVPISEQLNRLTAKIRTSSQTVAITDNVARTIVGGQKNVVKTITQTVAISESIARRVAKSRSFIETIPLSDIVARLGAKSRSIPTQITAIADSVTRLKTRVIVRAVPTQIVTIGDSIARRTTKARGLFETVIISSILQGFKNGVELIPPIIEPPNLIGFKRVIARKPKYAYRVKEITTVEQQATANIKIPAFKYQINKAWGSIKIVELVEKAISRLLITVKEPAQISSSLILPHQIKQLANISRIQIPPTYRQITRSKILNPKAQRRLTALIRLFLTVNKIE